MSLKVCLLVFLLAPCLGLHLPVAAQTASDARADSRATYFAPTQILQFADYLWRQNETARAAAEYERYLFLGDVRRAPYASYQAGRSYMRLDRPDRAALHLERALRGVDRPSFRDSVTIALAAAHLVAGHDTAFTRIVDAYKEAPSSSIAQHLGLLKGLRHLGRSEWDAAHMVLAPLALRTADPDIEAGALASAHLAERGLSMPRKSAWLAGLSSAVLPGSGKMYAGRKGDGLYSLFLVGGATWLAYDGFRDDGSKSFKGWLFSGVSSLFYLGNIYGSVVAVRLYNRGFETHIRNDVQALIVVWTRL